MRLCRYDDDRLGVVRGNMVHDVTEAQSKIRAAAPYAMKGDAVIAESPLGITIDGRDIDDPAGQSRGFTSVENAPVSR